MTYEFFQVHMSNVLKTFGKEHYPALKVQVIWETVKDLDADEFQKLVKFLIGNQPVQYPPQERHFREQAYEIRQARFGQTVKQAAKVITRDASKGGLKEFLDRIGAKSVMDAFKRAKSNPKRPIEEAGNE